MKYFYFLLISMLFIFNFASNPFMIQAQSTASYSPVIYYNFLKSAILGSLRCGQVPTPISAWMQLKQCLLEAVSSLKGISLLFLALAIIGSGIYLLTTPLFGLKNIALAYKILTWSIIGFIIIFTADIIVEQLDLLLR